MTENSSGTLQDDLLQPFVNGSGEFRLQFWRTTILLVATETRARYLHSPGWGHSRASRIQKCRFALREASAMKEQLLGVTSCAPLFEAVDVAPSP